MAHEKKDYARSARLRKKIDNGIDLTPEEEAWLGEYEDNRSPAGRKPTRHISTPAPKREVAARVEKTESIASLESIASESDNAVSQSGGKCPNCGNPTDDGTRNCPKCGVWVKLNECQKCHKEVTPGSHCVGCGTIAPIAPVKQSVAIAKTVPVVGEVVEENWDKDSSEWVAETVSMLLELDDCDGLDEDEKAKITKRVVPVLNKYARAGGKYGDLIMLGVSIGTACVPRLWVRHIVNKEIEKKKAERDRGNQ